MGINVLQDVPAALASEVSGLIGVVIVHLAFVIAVFENKACHFAVDKSASHGDGFSSVQEDVQFVVGPDHLRAIPVPDRRFQVCQIDGSIPDCADGCCASSMDVLPDEVLQGQALNAGFHCDIVLCNRSGALTPSGELEKEVCAVQHGEADPHVVSVLHADGQGGRVQRQVACLADDPCGVIKLRLVGFQP